MCLPSHKDGLVQQVMNLCTGNACPICSLLFISSRDLHDHLFEGHLEEDLTKYLKNPTTPLCPRCNEDLTIHYHESTDYVYDKKSKKYVKAIEELVEVLCGNCGKDVSDLSLRLNLWKEVKCEKCHGNVFMQDKDEGLYVRCAEPSCGKVRDKPIRFKIVEVDWR